MKIFWLSFVIAVADQVIKQIIRTQFLLGETVSVIGDGFFRLSYIENPGMAFGIQPGNKMFFTLLTILIVIGLIVYQFQIRKDSLYQRLPLAIILGGAFGNLIDRIFYGVWFQMDTWFHGRVVDYLDFDFPDIDFAGIYMTRWPVFNLADMAVSIGVVLMIIFINKGSILDEDDEDGTVVSDKSSEAKIPN
ncbi:MAG: signal peptidase II [Bacteroidetes bacterium]|nr:signal peptidase II [Bacteroidota bacterium]